ncbi:MAG: radical SAM protein [Epulopiscium sp. Nele67-Bin004]|nr:MAG: radical SAM protein [Epulopiscium sp. Nele67-Bin004]
MKDYVKMTQNIDEKALEKELASIKQLQEQGEHPISYDLPITLQFELTENCNLKCKHCYNSSGITTHKDRMTPEKWIEFSKYIVDLGGIFQCIISGGEPLLLGDKLFEIMDILHENGTSFVMISNGFLLTSEIVKKLSKYRFMWFQISIDGATPDYHDDFRGVNDSWARATNAAYEISKAGIPLTIAHSISKQSVKEIDEMCELAYKLGASNLILGEITPSGRAVENQDILLSMEDRNMILQKVNENVVNYQGRMQIQRSSKTKLQLKKYQGTPNGGAIIRPNGDIRLDCMTPFIIGNVLDNDFNEIWKEKSASCWHNPMIYDYIENIDAEYDANKEHQNYIDKDVLI